MRIGIEAERANTSHPTGVEHYAKQLILALAELDQQNEYVLYLRTSPQNWILQLPRNFKYKVMPFPLFWTQLRISWEMLAHPVDVLFVMASALPFIHPERSVVTIHDLAWEYFPQTFKTLTRWYLQLSTWHSCVFAKKIIAVSEQTKRDIVKKYALEPGKVAVVYHGFDTKELRGSAADATVSVTAAEDQTAKLPSKFILYLGTLQPRKNITALVDAFIALKREKHIPHSLVIAGGRGWLYDQIMRKIADHPEVIYLGYVADRFAVVRKADLMVQPALYEGFGLGVLDAFACDVPVACSNVSSLPEVAGDAAEYFDPHSIEEMKQAMYNIVTNPVRREQLVEKGKVRLLQFTWQRCASETLKILSER